MTHIFLYGPPGSGKSTIGKLLADSLRLPFIDLDEAIQAKAGMPIPGIMEEGGESGFRDIESSVLRELLETEECVIALGGGTLLRDENRKLVERDGQILCLRAQAQVLLQRLHGETNERPLLAGNLGELLVALLATRANHYDSFLQQFRADQSPPAIIEQIQTAIGRFHLSTMGDHDVIVEDGGLDRLGELLASESITHLLVITDKNVAEHHSARVLDSLKCANFDPKLVILPAGESSKTLVTVSRLWQEMLQAGLDRKSTVIALGGGVVGDLTGFAASTFMRGIDWVSVPTTLLSMVDASLGGKTGFDLPEGKNLIGSFHAPRLVLSDPRVLGTLPEAELRAGFAEVVKHGIVADPELFDSCALGLTRVKETLPHIVRAAAAVKIKIIEADPYERGQRTALNLGHTIGHAVELVSRYGIRHGEAVAMGLVAEARLAERLAVAKDGLSKQIAEVLESLGLPIHIPVELPRHELVRAMSVDKKKAAGIVRFALPAKIGRVRINVEVSDLQLAFQED
jgi:shikimate kinase / 3-dehydroquinate synthase